MKSALAAMLVAASRLASDAPSCGRLSLLFTADEENGSAYGAHVAHSVPLHAHGVVIGEPGGIDEDYDRLHVVSRGIARLRLVAGGRQGHSSLSDELGTRNAGVDAARLVTEVADSLAVDTPENVHGLSGWTPTVNTGMAYRGGVGFGVLPGVMAVDTEVRLLPGMRREAVTEAFTTLADRVSQETGGEFQIEFDQPPGDWLPATRLSRQPTRRGGAGGLPGGLGYRSHHGGLPWHHGRYLVPRASEPTHPAGPRTRPPAPSPLRRRVGLDHGGATGRRNLHPPRYVLLFRTHHSSRARGDPAMTQGGIIDAHAHVFRPAAISPRDVDQLAPAGRDARWKTCSRSWQLAGWTVQY